ncbi:MAG: hypothetical protein PSV16_00650 [Flavobacterium sp.]|nr:hypothetical protein [Flavobacterium sp.]
MTTDSENQKSPGEDEVKKLDDDNSYLVGNIRIANESENGILTAEFLGEAPKKIKAKELEASLKLREEALEKFIEEIPDMPDLVKLLNKYKTKKPS